MSPNFYTRLFNLLTKTQTSTEKRRMYKEVRSSIIILNIFQCVLSLTTPSFLMSRLRSSCRRESQVVLSTRQLGPGGPYSTSRSSEVFHMVCPRLSNEDCTFVCHPFSAHRRQRNFSSKSVSVPRTCSNRLCNLSLLTFQKKK